MNLVGQTLAGRYYVESHIGAGGMAVVYRARDVSLNREVALKVLPREFLHDPTFRERFVREAQTIGGLEHPAIVPIYGFGDHEGQPYFAMRYMSGGSLADRISGDLLPLDTVSQTIERIGSALDAAHARAIIHRDVKPGNILFDYENRAYLSDFGIVRIAEATVQLTGSGFVGTPAYMAPEMSRRGGLTHLVDVYALGVTLFEMLSGCQPYQADTPMGTAMAHTTIPIPNILDIRDDLPGKVQSVINQALAKVPDERYQSAGELADGFSWALGRSSVEVSGIARKEEGSPSHKIEPDDIEPTRMEVVQPTLPEIEPPEDSPVIEQPESKPKPWLWVGVVGAIGLVTLAVVIIGIVALSGAFSRSAEPTEDVAEVQVTATTVTVTASPEPTSTPPPTAILEPTSSAVDIAFSGDITRNAEWEPYIEKINGVEMVLVPAGCFDMGSTVADAMAICEEDRGPGVCKTDWFRNEEPVHEVCFDEPFWIDVYEVTNSAYAVFLNNVGNKAEGGETWLDPYDEDTLIHKSGGTWLADSNYGDHPVIEVTWYGAVAYCEWMGEKLPTEAEWEYAARGPDALVFTWGNDFDCSMGNFDDETRLDLYLIPGGEGCDGYIRTSPVGSFPRGISWVGAYDMIGNVWEWVTDWYDANYYATLISGVVDPQGSNSGDRRVQRGGSWDSFDSNGVRAADRDASDPVESYGGVGFRCILPYSVE